MMKPVVILPALLMDAARSAAEADGVAPSKSAHKKRRISDSFSNLKQSKTGVDMSTTNARALDSAVPINDGHADESDAQAVIEAPSAGASAHLLAGSSAVNRVPSAAETSKSGSSTTPPAMKTESGNASNTSEPSNELGRRRAPLRRGKWTPEEEAYANRLILEFKAGLLPLTDGTTLRTFLSKLLNCDPMRISKKFVGSNCIGKQVFRRRALDVDRLTPDQIQKSRNELSELEMKFLDRVAQNKSKASGGGRSSIIKQESSAEGLGLGMPGMNKSAAAAGRALLQSKPSSKVKSENNKSDGVGLLAQLQQSQPGMFNGSSVGNFLAAASGHAQTVPSSQPHATSNTARTQIARNASAVRSAGVDSASNSSMNNLMHQTGMSREQISQLAQAKGLSSSASLANMLGKQRSFDGLMSLDFQSMQSIDNLANLIQAGLPNQVPKGGMKNIDWGNCSANAPLANPGGLGNCNNGRSLTGAVSVKNEASTSLEKLVRSLSGNSSQAHTSNQHTSHANQTNATFGNLLQSMHAAPNMGINNLLQSIQGNTINHMGGANMHYGNLLQGMQGSHAPGTNNIETLLQNIQNGNVGNSSLHTDLTTLQQMQVGRNGNVNGVFNLMGGSGDLNQQNFNHLMPSDAFNGLQQGGQSNPMAAALAQQHLFSQTGGNQGMANLFAQQSGLGGMGAMAGNFGNLGGNYVGANLGGHLGGPNLGGNQNTAALLHQLISQQNGGGPSAGVNNSAVAALAQVKQEQQHLATGALIAGKQTGWGDQSILKRNYTDMNGGNPTDSGVTKKASL